MNNQCETRTPLYAALFSVTMFQVHRAAAGGCKPLLKCSMHCPRLGTQWLAEPPQKSDHCSSECPTAGDIVPPLLHSAVLQSHLSYVWLAVLYLETPYPLSPSSPPMHHFPYLVPRNLPPPSLSPTSCSYPPPHASSIAYDVHQATRALLSNTSLHITHQQVQSQCFCAAICTRGGPSV